MSGFTTFYLHSTTLNEAKLWHTTLPHGSHGEESVSIGTQTTLKENIQLNPDVLHSDYVKTSTSLVPRLYFSRPLEKEV